MAYPDKVLWTMLIACHAAVRERVARAPWRGKPREEADAIHDCLFNVYKGVPGARPDTREGRVSPAEAETPARLGAMLEQLHRFDPPGRRLL